MYEVLRVARLRLALQRAFLRRAILIFTPNMIISIMLAIYYLVVFDGEHNLNTSPIEPTDIGQIL